MELAPSFTITFSCSLLSQRKISSPCTSPRLSSEFCRTIQFSNCLLVWHYHDFSPKQIRSSEPFLNTVDLFFLYDSFIMSKTSQIRGLYFHFIKRQQSYLQSRCCRATGKTNNTIVSYQFPIRFVSKGSFDKLKLYFLDGFLQLVVLIP